MAAPHRRSTTQRGLGWAHQRRRAGLLRSHRDGAPCPCGDDCGPACPCRPAGRGLPMYRDPTRNIDRHPLEADHTRARSRGGRHADRLMLAVCNRSRQAGTRIYSAPTRPTPSRDW